MPKFILYSLSQVTWLFIQFKYLYAAEKCATMKKKSKRKNPDAGMKNI